MKKGIILLSTIAILVVIGFNAFSEKPEESNSVVVVRTKEVIGLLGTFKLTISNSSESVNSPEKKGSHDIKKNGAILANTLEEYFKQGYTLISSNSAGGGPNGYIITNYVLKKE